MYLNMHTCTHNQFALINITQSQLYCKRHLQTYMHAQDVGRQCMLRDMSCKSISERSFGMYTETYTLGSEGEQKHFTHLFLSLSSCHSYLYFRPLFILFLCFPSHHITLFLFSFFMLQYFQHKLIEKLTFLGC